LRRPRPASSGQPLYPGDAAAGSRVATSCHAGGVSGSALSTSSPCARPAPSQGRFKRPVGVNDLVTGMEYDRPYKNLRGCWIMEKVRFGCGTEFELPMVVCTAVVLQHDCGAGSFAGDAGEAKADSIRAATWGGDGQNRGPQIGRSGVERLCGRRAPLSQPRSCDCPQLPRAPTLPRRHNLDRPQKTHPHHPLLTRACTRPGGAGVCQARGQRDGDGRHGF
jgi:hypothetical protein